jgi:hypothetical protein
LALCEKLGKPEFARELAMGETEQAYRTLVEFAPTTAA